MGLSTQKHLASLREALLYRQHELQIEVRAAEAAGRGGAGEREPRDSKDQAARLTSDAVDAGEEQRDVAELQQVQSALQRLDAGLYGDCVKCGAPIALARLLVQPAAERCAACQTAFEALRAGRAAVSGG